MCACTEVIAALVTLTDGVVLVKLATASLNATTTWGRSSAPVWEPDVAVLLGNLAETAGVLSSSWIVPVTV